VTDDYSENRKEYWGQLFEWFDGECSPEQAAAIEQWIRSDADVARRVEIERAHWERLKRAASPLERVDTLSSLQKLQARREALERAEPVHAAPVVSARASARDSVWRSASLRNAARAALVFIALAGGLWFARIGMRDSDGRRVRESQYIAARGERLHITLPDGSNVMLAPDSKLTYAAREHDGPRVVALSGRAYFEVVHDPERPFSVHTGSTETDDVGTHFLVQAYPGDAQVQVAVAEGEVAVRTESASGGSGVHLTSGESAVVENGRMVSMAKQDDASDYAAWADGTYRLHDAPLTQVVREVSRWYDLDVQIGDAGLAAQRLSVTVGGEPPDHLLATIARATNARYVRHERVVVLLPR
jgi:transmembrane sensor